MDESFVPPRWFYRSGKTKEAVGPFDLLELAGYLAAGEITAETLTRAESGGEWVPFGSAGNSSRRRRCRWN